MMPNNTNTERTIIKAKLRALFAKTTENGCTEAEALAAAQKASELMSIYNLSYSSEDEVKSERYGARHRPMNGNLQRRNPHEVRYITNSIGQLFGCKTWRVEKNIRVFFGTELDTESAHNMCDMLCMTMELEFNKFTASHPTSLDRRIIRKDFMFGMASRINSRIHQIITAQDIQTTNVAIKTGKSLIVITKKQELQHN